MLRISRSLACALTLLLASQVRADLFFPKNEVHLGKRRCGEPTEHVFEFWNNGRAPLRILQVKGSCGCFQPLLEKDVYAPGEKGRIQLQVRTLGQPAGSRQWQMDVIYEIEGKKYHRFVLLKAELIREIQVEPSNLTIHAKNRVRHEIVITDNRSPAPLPITKLSTSNPHLKAKVHGPRTNAENRQVVVVELIVEDTLPAGFHAETLTIYTQDSTYREIVVPVTVTMQSRAQVTANPSAVSISGSAVKALPSRIVLLRGADDQEVNVDRVECHHPALKCRWAKGPGKMSTLRILVEKNHKALSGFDSSVHVHLKDLEKPVVIPVKCEIRQQ